MTDSSPETAKQTDVCFEKASVSPSILFSKMSRKDSKILPAWFRGQFASGPRANVPSCYPLSASLMGKVVSSGGDLVEWGRVPPAPLEAWWSLYMAETAKRSRLCRNSSLLVPGIEHSYCSESQRIPGWESRL